MAEPDGTGLLLSYEAGNHLHRYGGRVFADGRYELYSGDGRSEPRWTSYEPFSAPQIAELDAAVDAASANVPDHVEGDVPPPPDSAKATFTLKGRTVEVDQWPKRAPELVALLDKLALLRKKPPVPSTWRVWSRGRVVELEARCDIGEVAALSRLRDALFMAGGAADAPASDDPPDGTPLVSLRLGDELLEVYADGRRIDHAAGKETTQELDADRVNAIRAALAETDWAALPSRLC